MKGESIKDYQNQLESRREHCENGKLDRENEILKFAYCEAVDREPSCDLCDLQIAKSQLNELIQNAVLIDEGED